jgi:hypothetical protein
MGQGRFDEDLIFEESSEEAGGLSDEGDVDDSEAAFLLIHPTVPFSSRTRSQPGFSARISKAFFIEALPMILYWMPGPSRRFT